MSRTITDKPASTEVPEINYDALIEAARKTHRKWVQGSMNCVAFAKGAEWFRGVAIEAGLTKPRVLGSYQTDAVHVHAVADTVEVYGIKDGKETLLGSAPMPVRMKARELAREQFGHFEEGDGSDAELCFGAMEQLLDHIASMQAYKAQADVAVTPEQRDYAIDAKLAEYGYPSNTRNAARAGWYACIKAYGIQAHGEEISMEPQ